MKKKKTSPSFSLLIPFRSDHGMRERIFNWLMVYYQSVLPEAEIITASDDGGEVINRSQMRNNCAALATTNTLLFIDADTLISPAYLRMAAQSIPAGSAMVQYQGLHWLHDEKTAAILQANPADGMPEIVIGQDTEHTSIDFPGLCYGMSRETFTAIGGFDERFTGWGEEDPALQCAVRGAVGEIVRIPITLFHMKHPFGAEHSTQTDEWQRNHAIHLEYQAIEATGDKRAMIDYCQHRQPFEWTPPAPPCVHSRAAMIFRNPDVKEADFFLSNHERANDCVMVPRWVTHDRLFQGCVANGVIRFVE